MAYCKYLKKFEWQNLIQTCIKLLTTFHWFSNIQKNEENILLFVIEKELLIIYNFDLTQIFDFNLTYKIYINWLQSRDVEAEAEAMKAIKFLWKRK